MPPQSNRLAPRANALANYIPMPTDPRAPQVDPRLSPGQYAQNVSAGLGYGLTNQLRGVEQLVRDPVTAFKEQLAAIGQLASNPAVALQMLRELRQRAAAGPLGFGEVVGELLPTPGRRPPSNALRITAPIDMTKRRAQQLLDEEAADTASLAAASDAAVRKEDVDALLQNESWLKQADRRAKVIAKLEGLGLPVSAAPDLSSWRGIKETAARFDDPAALRTARILLDRDRSAIDQSFDAYLAAVRAYRKQLNPRSKYDRARIAEIDAVLGDSRVIDIKGR
jgi:hypothetical protein